MLAIGLKFGNRSLSRSDFFRRGRRWDIFSVFGNSPSESDVLTISVSIGVNDSRWFLSTLAGIGSNEHVYIDRDLMIPRTELSLSGWNSLKPQWGSFGDGDDIATSMFSLYSSSSFSNISNFVNDV
jgi:hypothetical protein